MLRLVGTPAAPGMAAGPIVRVGGAKRKARERRSAAEERRQIDAALAAAQSSLTMLMDSMGDSEAGGILAFQLALLPATRPGVRS